MDERVGDRRPPVGIIDDWQLVQRVISKQLYGRAQRGIWAARLGSARVMT